MDVLITCKYEEDPIKNEGARVVTTLYINISDAQGQITLVLVVVSGRNLNSSKLSCMSLLPARMRMIKVYGNFSRRSRAANSAVLGPIWLNFELVRDVMFLLPASMKKIRSKMKALEWSQHFSHYNPMGAIGCHGHQSSDPIWSKT